MAHYNFKFTIALFALLCLSAQAAQCQSYRGNSRVLQAAGGLSTQPGSYITGGTLSRSAQAGAGLSNYLPSGASTSGVNSAGLTPGASGNTNLQSARMGSTVGMPGDYMRSDLNPNFSYQQQPRQQMRYRNQQGNYQQQQQGGNQVATYGQTYSRNSQPTGRQAMQVPTITHSNNNSGGAQPGSPNNSNGGGGASYSGNTASAYKGY